jgi:hypothetical protein
MALTGSDGAAVFTISNVSENDGVYISEHRVHANACYTFTINDSVGDGICCGYTPREALRKVLKVSGHQRAGGGGSVSFYLSYDRPVVQHIFDLL